MTDCAAPRHLDAPDIPPCPQGSRLCHPCLARLRSHLRALPALHALMTASLDPRRAGYIGVNGGGLPYNEPAAECASQIRHDLRMLCTWVLAERAPASCPVPQVPAMAGWLHGWTPWIAGRSWAPDAAGAIAADTGRARALLDPMPCSLIPIPADVNWCPRCGQAGGLSAFVWQHPADRRPSGVECGRCEHWWDTPQWLRLGRDIIRHVTAAAA